MHLPIRLIRGHWPRIVERRASRLLRVDPRILFDREPDPTAFRSAMSYLYVGNTIKITGPARHRLSDHMLTKNVDSSASVIVDIGASDGSTSLDLINRLTSFKAYFIADLYLEISAVRVGKTIVFKDKDGVCILVAGAQTMAWPTLSRTVRALCYPYIASARMQKGEVVLLLNPEVRKMVDADPRVRTKVYDIFTPWPGPIPDIIKVANVLRRLYFNDDQIRRALAVLHSTLPNGGHLLIVDNPRIPGIDERGALYRRNGPVFNLIATTPHPPEISDLIDAVGRGVMGAG